MYKIVFTNEAEKAYRWLKDTNEALFKRLRTAIWSLAKDPYQGKPLKLKLKGKWSYRVGIYRIIYKIEKERLIVYIITIGHRCEVYD